MLEMLGEVRGEFHHVNGVFADDFCEFRIRADHPLVGGILEVVCFDVFPDFFGCLWTREFWYAEEISESRREFVGVLGHGSLFGSSWG